MKIKFKLFNKLTLICNIKTQLCLFNSEQWWGAALVERWIIHYKLSASSLMKASFIGSSGELRPGLITIKNTEIMTHLSCCSSRLHRPTNELFLHKMKRKLSSFSLSCANKQKRNYLLSSIHYT